MRTWWTRVAGGIFRGTLPRLSPAKHARPRGGRPFPQDPGRGAVDSRQRGHWRACRARQPGNADPAVTAQLRQPVWRAWARRPLVLRGEDAVAPLSRATRPLCAAGCAGWARRVSFRLLYAISLAEEAAQPGPVVVSCSKLLALPW